MSVQYTLKNGFLSRVIFDFDSGFHVGSHLKSSILQLDKWYFHTFKWTLVDVYYILQQSIHSYSYTINPKYNTVALQFATNNIAKTKMTQNPCIPSKSRK